MKVYLFYIFYVTILYILFAQLPKQFDQVDTSSFNLGENYQSIIGQLSSTLLGPCSDVKFFIHIYLTFGHFFSTDSRGMLQNVLDCIPIKSFFSSFRGWTQFLAFIGESRYQVDKSNVWLNLVFIINRAIVYKCYFCL